MCLQLATSAAFWAYSEAFQSQDDQHIAHELPPLDQKAKVIKVS